MKHLGDIRSISGYDVPTVEVIIGGSPCQDLSVAGKRAGLDGEHSGLFMEQIRLIREMRENDRANGRTDEFIRPRFMVWENVPGAFSSNGGKISGSFSKKQSGSPNRQPLFLDLRKTSGLMQDALWETDGLSLGEYSMHSFGECPREDVESHLSQILEEMPHPKYCLSAKACQGILNRAKKRKKQLPLMLAVALKRQARSASAMEYPLTQVTL